MDSHGPVPLSSGPICILKFKFIPHSAHLKVIEAHSPYPRVQLWEGRPAISPLQESRSRLKIRNARIAPASLRRDQLCFLASLRLRSIVTAPLRRDPPLRRGSTPNTITLFFPTLSPCPPPPPPPPSLTKHQRHPPGLTPLHPLLMDRAVGGHGVHSLAEGAEAHSASGGSRFGRCKRSFSPLSPSPSAHGM